MFRRLNRLFFDAQVTAELSLAQWHVLRRQVPLMYALLLINTIILAATHYGNAPAVLTIYIPATLTVMCLWRIRLWWRVKAEDVTPARARRDVMSLVILGPPIAVVFTAWGLSLYGYGNAYQQSHVAFYMARSPSPACFASSACGWPRLLLARVCWCRSAPFS